MPAHQRRDHHQSAGSSSTHHVNDIGNMLDKVNFGSPPITRITVPTPTSPNGPGGFPVGGASDGTTPEMVRSSRSSTSQSVPNHHNNGIYNHNNQHLSYSFTGSVTHEIVYEFDDDVPEVDDGPSLDDLWSSLRHKKEKRMAKEKSKVDSLEVHSKQPSRANTSRELSAKDIVPPPKSSAVVEDVQEPLASPPLPPPPLPAATTETPASEYPPPRSMRPSDMASPPRKKTVQRQKSVTSFRESPDGRTMVTSIDMRNTHKDNVHVSFQRTRLVVTWASQEITDWEDENGLWVRERHTKEYQRMFPLPEGTRFDEIASAFAAGGKHLLLRYPNSRSFRVERVPEDD